MLCKFMVLRRNIMEIGKYIDSTNLKMDATEKDIIKL